MRTKSGFTMAEVIVAIIIIGVLAALAVPSYRIQMLRVKNQEAFRILMAVWEAEKDYFRDNGAYTDNIADLAVEIPPMKNFTNLTVCQSFPCGADDWPLFFRAMVDSGDFSYRIVIKSDGTFFVVPFLYRLLASRIPCVVQWACPVLRRFVFDSCPPGFGV